MVSNVNNTNSDNLSFMMAELCKKINKADTDGIEGISQKELAAVIETGDSDETSLFLKSLLEQFDKLDSDFDGQLSAKEISSIKIKEPLGPPPGTAIDLENKTKFKNFLTDAGNSFVDILIKNYENGNLSKLASTFGLSK